MKKKILIYDDEEEILFLCKTILTKNDFEVQTFSRCENILEEVDSHKPDLILMDLWIPEMGGEKCVRILREKADAMHVPVLLFSANADIQEICLKVNAEGYIEKPFNVKSFLEMIRKHTD